MKTDCSIGPFSFCAGRALRVAGVDSRRWTLYYGEQQLAERTVPEAATQYGVRDAFADDMGAFAADLRRRHAPGLVRLHDVTTGLDLAAFAVSGGVVPGMSAGLPDDRWQHWIVSASRPTFSMPLESLGEFARLQCEHEAPRNAWIAELLPEHVLAADPDEWEAPTAWQIRHVVGEGSFTGVTGAAAAALVGVTPQNFRKYLAPEGASTRQRMSYALWHLLMHRLGVQRVLVDPSHCRTGS
ncbi:hypothetical protein [Azohydromonas lata]|uniref:hypothetical protein n=1 Tax=Azohydromonas lata TaxID=45677 RepID=UPI0008368E77|nr:hypothetical protein [Azohydromonas lata]